MVCNITFVYVKNRAIDTIRFINIFLNRTDQERLDCVGNHLSEIWHFLPSRLSVYFCLLISWLPV